MRQPVARLFKRIKISFFNRLRETAHLIPPELEGVNILVYTPEEFIEMKREGNAFAEMIMEEGIIIYDRQTENSGQALVPTSLLRSEGRALEY